MLKDANTFYKMLCKENNIPNITWKGIQKVLKKLGLEDESNSEHSVTCVWKKKMLRRAPSGPMHLVIARALAEYPVNADKFRLKGGAQVVHNQVDTDTSTPTVQPLITQQRFQAVRMIRKPLNISYGAVMHFALQWAKAERCMQNFDLFIEKEMVALQNCCKLVEIPKGVTVFELGNQVQKFIKDHDPSFSPMMQMDHGLWADGSVEPSAADQASSSSPSVEM